MEDEAWVVCPYCHQSQLLVVDPETQGSMIQDCDVCCQPWSIRVSRDFTGTLQVEIDRAS